MPQMLLINPRKRRRAPVKRRAARRVGAKRRRNPVRIGIPRRVTSRMRKANPIRRIRRRRRNPIGGRRLLSASGLSAMFKDAALGAAGAVAVDVAMGQISSYLPASLQRTPGALGVGDAVKAALTVVLGQVLAKPTKGMSRKMAAGALVVQMADAIKTFLPSTLTLGYYSPARLVQGTNRVGPIRRGMNAYTDPGTGSPMLNAYTRAGATPLLSGQREMSTAEREGVTQYR